MFAVQRRLVAIWLLATLSAVICLSDSSVDQLEILVRSRAKRQLFGNRRRRQDPNLYPGRDGPTLMYQGLFIPDKRFNSFADGIITNMVADMRSANLDPLYFRITNRGRVVSHDTRARDNTANAGDIPALLSGSARQLNGPARGSTTRDKTGTGGATRQSRQLAPARSYATGLLEGLTNINRRGDVEVQVASNVTLVRGRWLLGPLVYRVNFYESRYTTRSLATEIPPIQMDTVTQISYIGADMGDFILGCPLMASIRFLGNITSNDHDAAHQGLDNLFEFNSFLYEAMRGAFESASFARLPLYTSSSNDVHTVSRPHRNNALLLLGRRRRRAAEPATNQPRPQRTMASSGDSEAE